LTSRWLEEEGVPGGDKTRAKVPEWERKIEIHRGRAHVSEFSVTDDEEGLEKEGQS